MLVPELGKIFSSHNKYRKPYKRKGGRR